MVDERNERNKIKWKRNRQIDTEREKKNTLFDDNAAMHQYRGQYSLNNK